MGEKSRAQLFLESLENWLTEPRRGGPYQDGSLFLGTSEFTLKRWGFWKRRFGDLRGGYGDAIRELIDEAVKVMGVIEKEAAAGFAV